MQRIQLSPLDPTHAPFIIELVNSPGWLEFIGERNVKTVKDALAYIDKIEANAMVNYRVIQSITTQQPVGIVTYIQRDYLDNPDIGFALLPRFEKLGYAFEAMSILLEELSQNEEYKKILAITLPHNTKSIQLLERLGLNRCREIEIEGKTLSLYEKDLR